VQLLFAEGVAELLYLIERERGVFAVMNAHAVSLVDVVESTLIGLQVGSRMMTQSHLLLLLVLTCLLYFFYLFL